MCVPEWSGVIRLVSVSVPRGCVRASPRHPQGLVSKWPPPRACGCRNPSFLLRQSLGGKGQQAEPLPGRASDRRGPRAPPPSCPRPRPRAPDSNPLPTPRDSTPRSLRGHTVDVRTLRDGLSRSNEEREKVGDRTGWTPRRRCASETPVADSLLAPKEQHGDGQGRGRRWGRGLGSGGGAWAVGASRSLSATLSPTRGQLVLAKSRFFCGSAVSLSSCYVPAGEGPT